MGDDKLLKQVISDITKKYGEGTLVDFSQPNSKVDVETFSTGLPTLDLILGGGIPKGRLIEIFGHEMSGKSTMSLHMMAKAQADGKKIAYIDIEHSFDPKYAEKLGIDLSNLLMCQPDSGEQALDIVEKLCQSGQVSVVVVDSVASLVPMAVAAKEIDGTANIGTTARLLSQTLPRIALAASKSGTTVIFINQIRMKIGVVYGNPETTPGGMALKFFSSIRLEVSRSKAEERNGKSGMPVKIAVRKNKIAPPFRKTELFLVFGEGFDAMSDLLEAAIGVGIVEQKGGWFLYDKLKVQGQVAFAAAVQADPKILAEITAKLAKVRT